MLVQPRKQISVLSLLDPEIPGGILLPDGTWGINLAAARLNFIKGLKTQISAWNNMSVGDNCKLLLNKTMVDQKTITDKIEVDKRVTLFVAPERLPSGDWELSYQITRFGQKPEPGPSIKLFVKLELPGGQDTNPDYGHSELTMAFDPPDVVRDGVDKATAEEGVLIYAKPKPGDGWLYRNCAVGDVLILAWAGKTVESEPVTQEQLDDPEGNPIVVLADEATILSAGDSDGVSVSYKIRDRVHNESEDWCEAVRIVVDTQGLRLGAPLLKQADGLVVDLEALGEELPLVEVWAVDVNIFKKFDEIYLSVFGTDDEGTEISELVIQRIETTPPVRVSIAHNNSTLRALAKRTVVYSYHVRRGGVVVDNSRSKSRAYSVIGEATRLAAPIAIDQISGALDPNAPEYRIRIPYDPLITPDNAIELKLFGTRSDLTIYDPELDWYFPSQDEADDPAGFIVTVEGEHGKTLEGGTLRLSYNLLTDENGTITRRASLHASLLNVGKAQRELVKPIVLGEKDGALEPKDLPGGVSKITAPRPVAVPTEPYDIVKFFWIVEGNEPVTDSKVLNTLSKDKDVNFPLNAAFVAQHIEPNRGKKVKVNYEIFRAASNTTSYSNDLEFTVGQPVALDPPTIASVKESPSGKDIVEGGTTVETSVVLSGMAAKGKNVEIRDGATVKDQVTADPVSGIWTYTASGLSVTKHSFTAIGKYAAEPVSAAYTLTVTAVIVPTLSNVLDDKNVEIPEGQTTVSTALTLKGTASKGQRVEIFDGNGASHTSKGVATASTTTGIWELSITVAVGARRLYAGSLYTPSPQWSNVRTLTVTAAAAPTLTSVKGSPSDVEIPQGGVTGETAVTLSGVAAKGQKVEVFDGTTSLGITDADVTTGIWFKKITDLTKKEHKFTAKGRYGNNPVSSSRTLFVAFIHTWVGLTSGKPPINVPQNYPSGMKLTVLRNDGHSNGFNTFYTTVADYPNLPRYLNFARNSVATFSFNSSVRGFGFNSNATPSHGDKFRLLRSNGTAIGTYFFPNKDFMFISENEPFTTVELTSGSNYPNISTHSFGIDAVTWIPDK
ncbi:Ig-like domain-containing protein [Pseudomonas sp. NPDC085632]|uniref:Ig-like domain-containing protein n=1 Tax=Pseudomonas sp. NPDC085632 TaxID=3364429 RepID=UPI0037CAAA25